MLMMLAEIGKGTMMMLDGTQKHWQRDGSNSDDAGRLWKGEGC